ncbi:MAG: chemotaxis protein CheW [Myxococcaceae bacterium]|nr:chemotaxis protein CheW [Myxococcaceae bacterium]
MAAPLPSFLSRFFYRPDEAGAGALSWLDSSPVEIPRRSQIPDSQLEVLAVQLSDERYAVPVDRVREIVKVPPLTWVPRVQPGLLGVMNLRGEVLPVYDVAPRLGLRDAPVGLEGAAALPRSARVVLVRDEAGAAGILVDAVHGVVRLPAQGLEPAPAGAYERGAIAALGRIDDELYIVLDLGAVLP